MTDTTFTFRVDEDLKRAFVESAKVADRSAAQILRAAMRQFVAEQDAEAAAAGWLPAKLRRARADVAAGRIYDHADMKTRFARYRAAARAAAV
ncbi:ribbon-helix-helix protein, CopG family [Chakrabartia godavariana]|nr:ribbon-helix-helix protein, CopG family [Chakrabartia godavariana]